MKPLIKAKFAAGRAFQAVGFVLLSLIIAGGSPAVYVRQSVEGPAPAKADRYYIRVSGCDDAGRAYLDGQLVVNVGFNEDSDWLDITEDVAQGKDEIRFEVINRTGAITYLFQVKKNDALIFEQACGKAGEQGCENNRAFRVGKARKFTYAIRKNQ